MDRFDGSKAWAELTPNEQAAVGAAALELLVAWTGYSFAEDQVRVRAYEASESVITGKLYAAAGRVLPDDDVEPPVPALLGQLCRQCGCSQLDACWPSCSWAKEDLCSACAEREQVGAGP